VIYLIPIWAIIKVTPSSWWHATVCCTYKQQDSRDRVFDTFISNFDSYRRHTFSKLRETNLKKMPGPRNTKAKRKASGKKEKQRASTKGYRNVSGCSQFSAMTTTTTSSGLQSSDSDQELSEVDDNSIKQSFDSEPRIASGTSSPEFVAISPPPILDKMSHLQITEEEEDTLHPPIPQPCIHDPGNGPRVRDVEGFLQSRFSSPPSWEDWECMTYHEQEVMDFLTQLLPVEQALVCLLLCIHTFRLILTAAFADTIL